LLHQAATAVRVLLVPLVVAVVVAVLGHRLRLPFQCGPFLMFYFYFCLVVAAQVHLASI
jgi:hypothetical protein